MPKEKTLSQHVVKLLQASEAHAGFDTVFKNIPAALRGKTTKGAEH